MRFSQIASKNPHFATTQTVRWTDLEETLARYDSMERGVLRLDPDFQREHVWTEAQQRSYVEHILQGGMSGRDIYFNQADWGTNWRLPMVLVDGKQRLEAVRKFLRGELAICLNGQWCFINDFEDRPYRVEFNIHIATLKTEREVIQWYLNLNTGGTPHTAEEIARVRTLLETK